MNSGIDALSPRENDMALPSDLPPAIALCIPRLYGGGAEKVMAHMADWWAERDVHVHMITFHATPGDPPLHSRIRRIQLDDYRPKDAPCIPEWPQESSNIHALRHALLDIIDREGEMERLPVISFLARMNMRCLLAARGLPCSTIISERIFPPAVFLGEHDEMLRNTIYPQADALVVQTNYTKTHWGDRLISPLKCHVIANPITLRRSVSERDDGFYRHQRYFLAVGRLTAQKRHDLLLRAFAQVIQRSPQLHLNIAGEGEMEQFLLGLRSKLSLENNVTFLGHVKNISSLLRNALALIHTSDFEGFPNILLEALAEGCPVIATDCPAGPAEIILHQKNGFLVSVNDQNALSQAMLKILDDSVQQSFRTWDRTYLKKFSEDTIMELWSKLCKSHLQSNSQLVTSYNKTQQQ